MQLQVSAGHGRLCEGGEGCMDLARNLIDVETSIWIRTAAGNQLISLSLSSVQIFYINNPEIWPLLSRSLLRAIFLFIFPALRFRARFFFPRSACARTKESGEATRAAPTEEVHALPMRRTYCAAPTAPHIALTQNLTRRHPICCGAGSCLWETTNTTLASHIEAR